MKNLKEERLGQVKLMNCGENATIIEYNNANDITVKFDDGTIVNTSYCAFNNNKVYKIGLKEKHFIQAQQRLGQTKLMNCGESATIIEYYNNHNISVKFNDGTIMKHCAYANFKKGKIAKRKNQNFKIDQSKERIGQTKEMNCGMKCTIIEYINSTNITVQFEDGFISKKREYREFREGGIQNKNLPRYKYKNLIGMKFNKWTVIDEDLKLSEEKKTRYWICKCECGTIRSVKGSLLQTNSSKSCGLCNNKIKNNLILCNKEYPTIEEERPDLIEYIVDKKYLKYSIHSKKIIDVICPNCKNIYNIRIKTLTTNGCKCPKCSENISYPNKYIYCVLEQLVDNFYTEQTFGWSNNKRYDFYIKNLNCIIEAHGIQHYEDCFWSTAKEQQENDKYKYELAINNEITNYIVIDCRFSNHNFIKNSILNNEDFIKLFPNIFNIDWNFYKDIHTRKY